MKQIAVAGVFALAMAPGAVYAAAICGAANHGGVQLCTIDQTIYPNTLCNDGTPPVFWIHPGNAGSKQWLIWLEGGGDCVDTASCTARAHQHATSSNHLLTSAGYKAPARGAGILSFSKTENPALFDANIVEVHYCSSDFWSGAYASGTGFRNTDPTTWNFEGRTVAQAAIATLGELDLNFSGAQQILLGGDSAGGEGITVTANDLLPLLPAAAKVELINDAGFALNIGQYSPAAAPPYVYHGQPNAFDKVFTDALKLWHGRGDAVCAAKARSGQQQVDCYNASFVLQHGYVAVPAFIAESQIDTAQLQQELCTKTYGAGCHVPKCNGTTQGQYATAFGQAMAKALNDPGGAYSVMSPDEYMHVVLADSKTFNADFDFPGGAKLTPQAALASWLGKPTTRALHLGNAPGIPPCSISPHNE